MATCGNEASASKFMRIRTGDNYSLIRKSAVQLVVQEEKNVLVHMSHVGVVTIPGDSVETSRTLFDIMAKSLERDA